jgi:predicted transcriptional regulator
MAQASMIDGRGVAKLPDTDYKPVKVNDSGHLITLERAELLTAELRKQQVTARQYAVGIIRAKSLKIWEAYGLTDWQAYLSKSGINEYVKATPAFRRSIAVELTAEGWSQRQIAEAMGVKQPQIARDLASAKATDNPDESTVEDKPRKRRTLPEEMGKLAERFAAIVADREWTDEEAIALGSFVALVQAAMPSNVKVSTRNGKTRVTRK